MYAALKFVEGFFCAGLNVSSWVLMNELVGSSKRALVGNLYQASMAVGIVLYAVTARWKGENSRRYIFDKKS